MSWVAGQNYRGRAVQGEFAIKAIETTGTRYVEGLIEVTMGEQQGQRIRYRGYVNSAKNQEATAAELRAMGCKLQRWGDFSGIGTKEVLFKLLTDEAQDGSGKVFFRAAFVKPVPTIDRAKNAVSAEELDDMPPPPPPAKEGNGRGTGDDELPI